LLMNALHPGLPTLAFTSGEMHLIGDWPFNLTTIYVGLCLTV
jgi:hypothetical protein